ncbi:MAG: PKD domain-containing protein, partial [Bacilli bacterium]
RGARLEFTGPATLHGAAPAAQYALNASTGNAPFAVAFTDTSTGTPGWWRWDFGDGTTSNDQNPTHTYTEPGTYPVNLTAWTLYGEDTTSATVTVLEMPAARFTQNSTEGNAPLAVLFTDESTGNVTAWGWSFGDGETSTAQHPLHTYAAPGTYTVTLNASNAFGFNLNTHTDYIDVGNPPEVAFTTNATGGNAPLAVWFSDTSLNAPTSWLWSFGDGETSAQQSPVHTYAAPGTYAVTLAATNAYGEDSETKTDLITILTAPGASFTENVTEGNAPLAVQFTDTSTGDIIAWSWAFGDGETSADQSPVHTYAAPGTYTVTLNASNPYGYDLSTQTDLVTVLAPPAAGFTQNVTAGNAPLAVAFTDASTGNVTAWAWAFGDGQTSAQQSPVHTYAAAGLYTVTLNASNAYGYDLSTQPDLITVLTPPAAAFSANATVIPVGGTVLFTDASTGDITGWAWTFGDGETSTDQSPAHTYAAAGTYTVTLNATNAYGSGTETKVAYIDVGPVPVADFTADVTGGNTPLTVQFTDTTANNPTSWAWTFGDGETSTAQSPSHTYAAAGTYTVTLTASNAYGEDTETKIELVTALTPATASFTTDVTGGNAPLAVQFTDTSTGNVTGWAWTFGDGQTSTDQSPAHTYASPGLYTVTLNASNPYGYDLSTQTDLITVLTLPAAAFSANATLIPVGGTIQFTDASTGDITGWAWTFGDGEPSTAQNPSHTYSTAGLQTVSLTVSNPYGEDTETKTAYIDV